MMRKAFIYIYYLFLLPILLCSCDFNSNRGTTVLEVIYPSGYARDCYNRDKEAPIEGTSFHLVAEELEVDTKSREYELQILNEEEDILWQLSQPGYLPLLRGERAKEGSLWIVSEQWNTPHYIGYISGGLMESKIFLVDIEKNEILFQQELKENELYLTSVGTKCYFYHCGQRRKKQLLGLYTIPAIKAEIYYRDMKNWGEKVSIYSFDYELQPDRLDEKSVEDCIRFYLEQDKIKVSMTAYLQTEQNGKEQGCTEVSAVEILLE